MFFGRSGGRCTGKHNQQQSYVDSSHLLGLLAACPHARILSRVLSPAAARIDGAQKINFARHARTPADNGKQQRTS
jgi:hypothetical protein